VNTGLFIILAIVCIGGPLLAGAVVAGIKLGNWMFPARTYYQESKQ
jgi:hypothetical protein